MITTHSDEPEFRLTEQERQSVLFQIYSRLARLSPNAISLEQMTVRGGLKDVERNLDAIVEIVHRSTSEHVEAYLAQFLEDICMHCPNQEPSAHCPLRLNGTCALFRYPQTIVGAVRDALTKIQAARELS
jgi:hypothetical protein